MHFEYVFPVGCNREPRHCSLPMIPVLGFEAQVRYPSEAASAFRGKRQLESVLKQHLRHLVSKLLAKPEIVSCIHLRS